MIFRYIFSISSVLFTLSVLVQVYLAGMAIFVHPANWARHTSFVHLFELLPLIMLLAGWLGKAPKRLLWQSAGLLVLIVLQYLTANLQGPFPALAAAHPVIALLITGLAASVTGEAFSLTRQRFPAPSTG